MLRFLSSLFGAPARRSDGVDEQLLERATERAVDACDPRLRALPGYRKRLRAPVERAVTHVIALVNRLPPAADISAAAYAQDPRLRVFFVSPAHLQQAIGQCATVEAYLRTAAPAPDDAIFGLLSMTMTEKNVLGIDLRGDVLRRDVAQVAVNFADHRYLGPSASEAETRRELMRRGFDYLTERALECIVTARSRTVELDQQRQLLQRKLRALQRGEFGLGTLFAAAPGSRDPAALEAEIQSLEAELLRLGSGARVLEHSLEHLSATLGEPARWLDVRDIGLEVNQMLIRTTDGGPGSSFKLTLTELFSAQGVRRIVLQGRFPAAELPPRPDFFKEAQRYLA